MKTITDLRVQQRKKDRVNVYLEGMYAFSLHISIAEQLKLGQQLSPQECEALCRRDAIYKAYERALHYLSFRPRSRFEVNRYLGGKGIPGDVAREVVAKLEDARWLDDASFARFWVDNREDFKPRSRWALRTELRQKGVSDEIIEQALQDVNEEESVYRAALGRAQRLAHLDYQTFRRRLGGFLQRRGFGYSLVKDTVERLWRECASDQQEARGSSMDFGPSTKDRI